MCDIVRICDSGVTARIHPLGAELQSLADPSGREFMWQAGPAWRRHAPILFPIVGKLANDRFRHEGREYHLGQHGFARDRVFKLEDSGPAHARFSLEDDATTREIYPFRFRLDVAFRLSGGILSIAHHVSNPGTGDLIASLGAHPAFNWPLAEGLAKDDHRLAFSDPEPGPIHRLRAGLLDPTPLPTPIDGTFLALNEALFSSDAIILMRPGSRRVAFSAPGATPIALNWEGFEMLGLWSKPGANFLCIEPWFGIASPLGFTGEFRDKPGVFILPPGESRLFSYRIAIGDIACRSLGSSEP